MPETICKHCQIAFPASREGNDYCSGRCRVAALRQRRRVPSWPTYWAGSSPRLSERQRGGGSLSRHELGERLLEIAEQDDDGQPKTGRRYYYLALSHGYLTPDMSDTVAGRKSRHRAVKQVTEILGILRMRGELDWAMVLDLTRSLDEWRTYASPREAREHLRRAYDEDRWIGQPVYPLLIVEKDTLEPICRPLAERWQIPYCSSRGYGSLKLQHDVADMLRRRHARTGQFALPLFFSDLDPSGLDLQRAWEEAMDNFDAPLDVQGLSRLGLTRVQVDALDSPQLRAGIEVKPSDSRAASYIAVHGDRCWETDILPAATIEALVDAAIREQLDAELWNRRDEEIERARQRL
jgi:hypothetical protein